LASDESIAPVSAGVVVPGNQAIDAVHRQRRAAALFHPYHRAIADVLDERSAAGQRSLVLSVHSFTPVLHGSRRPWHVGFCYGRDSRLARLLIDDVAGDAGVVVGNNQPYRVDDSSDYTLPVHGEQRGLPHVLIEIRQDLLTSAAGCAGWAERLAAAYRRSAAALLA
ncbi:MAG TPA: N-formylglutamate amidohydrolase, partial [Rhodospirillales bacterium]|nr:N-formylglutamate amidohydrolase [Rhodospirillales bacterium]